MPIDREETLKKAETFLRQGRLEQAIAEYERVVEDQPRDLTTANALGDLYLRANKTERAVGVLLQQAGEGERALAVFLELEAGAAGYGDVAARIATLTRQTGG